MHWLIVFVNILMLQLSHANDERPLLKLDSFRPPSNKVKVLEYEPTAVDFYRDFMSSSVPVLIRSKSVSWKNSIEKLSDISFLREIIGNYSGKTYRRAVWTSGWPTETRLNFTQFIDTLSDNGLYWDSELPLNHKFLEYIPLPHFLNCPRLRKTISATTLLMTNQQATSVFHHDGSENLFYQIKGTKNWLLANHSFSREAYADSYDLQPGLAPINPEDVDVKKFPLVKDIEFYNVTTMPGDLLYVPEYWWHHVKSNDPPNIAFNIWMEYFNFGNLENVNNVTQYVKKYAELRSKTPMINCPQLRSVKQAMMTSKNPENPISNSNYLVYLGSDDGCFYGLNPDNGNVVWKHKTNQDAGSTGILNDDDLNPVVYFAGEDMFVYAFAALSGKVLWKQELGDAVTSALRYEPDTKVLFISCLDKHVYALDASNNGKIIWKSGPFQGELWGSPYLHNNGLIITVKTDEETFKDNFPTVVMLNKTDGSAIWNYSTKSSIFASPTVSEKDSVVFVTSYDSYLHSIDLNTGLQLGKIDVMEPCDASPVLYEDQGLIFATTLYGTLHCIRIADKSILYSKELAENENAMAISSPLLVPELNLLFSPVGNVLYAVDIQNGTVVWKFKAEDSFMSSPRLDKFGTLYIGNSDTFVYALKSTTGEVIWQQKTDGPVVGSVVIPTAYAAVMKGALL